MRLEGEEGGREPGDVQRQSGQQDWRLRVESRRLNQGGWMRVTSRWGQFGWR